MRRHIQVSALLCLFWSSACGDGCGDAQEDAQEYPLTCPEGRSLWRSVEGASTRYWCKNSDDIADGPYVAYQEDRKTLEGGFKDGFAEGLWTGFDTSDRVLFERMYARGVRCGDWNEYVAGMLTSTTSYTSCEEVRQGVSSQPVDAAPQIDIADAATACDGGAMVEAAERMESYFRRYCEGGGTYQIVNGGLVLVQGTLDATYQHVGPTYHFFDDGRVKSQGTYTRPKPGISWSIQDELAQPSGTFSFYSKNGALEERGTLEDGARQGTWTMYWANAEIKETGDYVDGAKHGEWLAFDPLGATLSEVNWDQGLRSGPARHYHPNGELESQGSYALDQRTGPWKTFDTRGTLRSEGVMKDNVYDGAWTFFDAQSRPLIDATFVDGLAQGTWFLHYYPEEGEQLEEASYVNGVAHGTWTAKWVDDGAPIYTQQWLDDQMNGPFTAWYRNGQMQRTGLFSNGHPHGFWQWWHENGQLEREGELVRGVPIGAWVYYHANGQRAEEGEFEGLSGRKKVGWTYWDEDGNIIEVEQ